MELRRFLISINVRWWNAEAAYALNLARGLKRRSLEVKMIVNRDSPVHKKADEAGIETICDLDLDSLSPVKQVSNYKKLRKLIEEHRIQVVNSFKSQGAPIFTKARKNNPGLLYIKTRGEARPPKNNFMNRQLYGVSSCDGIITAGQKVEGWFKDLKLKGQSIKTIHYGSDALVPSANYNKEELRQSLGMDELKVPVLGLVGRLQPVKGHAVLLESLRRITSEEYYCLLLVKDLEEYPEELQKTKEFIHVNRLEKRIKIIGFQPDLGDYLKLLDFGVVPSLDSEINCRVVVELFSLGVPVVSFPTGSLPEIIDHQKNGLVCGNKTPEDLTEAVRWMLESHKRREEMGQRAFQDYQKHYRLETMTEKTLQFYQSCKKGT